MEDKRENTFEKLNSINVNEMVKEKMGLNYLSWASAWGELLKNYPDSSYTIYTRTIESVEKVESKIDEDTTKITEQVSTYEVPYFTDGKTCFVKVGVTIKGVEFIEWYPVIDYRNASITLRAVTSSDINKALQRAFVKCVARHGLGLYIYTGEDLPDAEKNAPVEINESSNELDVVRQDVINLVTRATQKNSKHMPEIVRYIKENFGEVRLSQTTEEHLDALIRARKYIYELDI